MIRYETVCTNCLGKATIEDGDEEVPCAPCEGFGTHMTDDGMAIVNFLIRRGASFSLSPKAEFDLQDMNES